MFYKTPEEFIEAWYKGNVQWYERNEQDDGQINFFNITE